MLKYFLIGIFSFNYVICDLPCKFIDTINITDGYKDASQNFVYKGDVFPVGTYQEFDYIEDYLEERTKVDPHIRGCICNIKPCIRLCCQGHSDFFPSCDESDTFTVKNESGEDKEITLSDNNYGLLIGRPCFAMYEHDHEAGDDQWHLMKNGSVLTSYGIDSTDTYCLGITNQNIANAYFCFTHEDDEDFHLSVYPVGMLISVPFLIITFIIYAYIPELRNLHGKCLMCYIFALTMLYTSLITAQWYTRDINTELCFLIGYLVYVSVFMCFLWMNVMCYDIWNIVRKGITHRSIAHEHKKFGIYCSYAFGVTFLITITVMLIDHFQPFSSMYLPMMSDRKCWIQAEFSAEAIYLYIPISTIILTNIIFFVDTARKIWKFQSSIEEQDIRKRKRIVTRRFFVYLRLFILMGLTWCMESISWMYQEKSKLFYITDFFNCLQGLLIFIICVFDVRTRRLICKRFCPSKYANPQSHTYAADFSTTETVKLNEMR